MESSNKALLFVVFSLIAVGAFFGRSQIMKLINGSKRSVVKSFDNSLVQGGRVVVEAFGKPYVTEESFNKKLAQMLQASEYTKNMDLESFPAEAKLKFLKDWVNFLLIKDVWGKEHNVEKDPEFKRRYEESAEALKDSLIIDAFVQDLKKGIVVTDDEVSVEYHSNKDNYLKSRGGAHYAVAEFDNNAKAREFETQLSGIEEVKDFMSLAENLDGKPVDLGLVDAKGSSLGVNINQYPIEVKRLFFAKHVRPVSLVVADDKQFVVFATEKSAPVYHELDEIRPKIQMYLEELRQKDALEVALQEMNEKSNLVIKEEVFVKKPKKQSKVMSKKELQKFSEVEGDSDDQENDDIDGGSHN
jgi:hypothetical protein